MKRGGVHVPLLAFCVAAGTAPAQEPLTRLSVDSSGVEGNFSSLRPACSDDGRHVAFESFAGNLVAGDANHLRDIFVHDRATGVTVRVSVDSAGVEADGESVGPAISADGRFVAFESLATNLVANDANVVADVFVHDRDPDGNGIFDEGNGVTTRVSVDSAGAEGNKASGAPSLSADGMLVAFESSATNLVASDTNNASDIFVHDRGTATTVRASLTSTGTAGNRMSSLPAIARNGTHVAFVSSSTNLVANDTNGFPDIFVRDLVAGTTERVSESSSGLQANGRSVGPPSISADGSVVAFFSIANNLVPFDQNTVLDVFVRESQLGAVTRVSVDSTGIEGNGGSLNPSLSADGTRVVFESKSDNLVTGDTNGQPDVFLHDLATATTSSISVNCVGEIGNEASFLPAISGDGVLVAFTTTATNLVPGDLNGVNDVLARDTSAAETDAGWTRYGTGFPGTLGVPTLTPTADPVLGTLIFLDTSNSLGAPTGGFLLLGLDQASIATGHGGTILVDIALVLPLVLDANGASTCLDIPLDFELCGVKGYVQSVVIDGGAAYGLAFTEGVELVVGH